MKKIAVMLPFPYKGGTLRAAKNFAKSIAHQARETGNNIQVVFSFAKSGDYDLNIDFSDLLEEDIVIRESEWKVFPKENLQGASSLLGLEKWMDEFDEFSLPTDGASDFIDCDLWLIISNRLPAPLFPLRKNAFVIYDFIERYVPEIFMNSDSFWEEYTSNFLASIRHASKVFVTTPSTQKDLISFAGVEEHKIHMLDLDFQPPELPKTDLKINLPDKYILWPTNTSLHKNHLNALNAYEIYSQELGGAFDLVITGTWTKAFDPQYEMDPDDLLLKYPHINEFRDKLRNDNSLAEKIHILGNIPDRVFIHFLKNAQYLWHPTLYDNGTFSVIEAAYLGVPSLSAQYPAMEFINQKFKLNLQFFNPRNKTEMANELKEMEKTIKSISLPNKKDLSRFGWKNLSESIYNEITVLL